MNARLLALVMLATLVVGATVSGAAGNRAPDPEALKAYALKLCLDSNYAKVGTLGPGAEKDRSYLLLQYALDNSRPKARQRLESFVKTTTADYYLAEVPMKDEGNVGPFNKIFAQCMDFYHSPALKKFLARDR
ncbi:MAG TPA: hypothetical protein VFZ09_42740 [Archangium sp.]|uniref:hypothetical protein n=1 Tax=Archangium sp. TaxID=1872627 RepID=UPI002E303C2B|nr:hypothetical protein [Archangium sp.]HEX5752996.1 hypothetical protein [Archangium sp.]